MHNFQKGDRVNIRSWESMETEFGLRSGGSINCKKVFTENMQKELEGLSATISCIEGCDVILYNWSDGKTHDDWNYSTDMIEPCGIKSEVKNKFKVGDIIKGTERGSCYAWTDINMTKGKVIRVKSANSVVVRVLEHESHCDEVGREYEVESEYFDFYDNKAEPKITNSNFYNYLMTYSLKNLQEFDDYLWTESSTYHIGSRSKSGIAKHIEEWLRSSSGSIYPRKSILNEMCKNVGLRDELRERMMAEVDKKISEFKANPDTTTLPSPDTTALSSINSKKTTKTKTETKKDEGKHMFKFDSVLENYMPSFATGDKLALAFGGGIAVKRSGGEYVRYNAENDSVENQMDLVMQDEDLSKMFLYMPTPVSKLVKGDIIINKGENFFTVLSTKGGKITGINMNTNAHSTINEETNIVFGEKLYKKVVSLFNMNGETDSVSPFGNMTNGMNPMVLAMMFGDKNDSDGDDDSDNSMLMKFAMLNMLGNSGTAMNPMMMFMLMGKKSGGSSDMMKMMMMSSLMGGNNPFFPTNTAEISDVTKATSAKPSRKSPKLKTEKEDVAAAE